MVFTEISYGIILVVSVVLFFILPSRFKPYIIFLSGLIFYYYFGGIFVFLLMAEIFVVYILTRNVSRNHLLFISGVGVSAGILAYYKYRNFVISIIHDILNFGGGGFFADTLVIPLAISFFTFELIHYTIDTRKRAIEKHRFIDFLAFIMFFPSMVAGPIKRFQKFHPQVSTARFSSNNMLAGGFRIILGLFKKVVIADTLTLWTTYLNNTYTVSTATHAALWIAILAYSFKIYFDFSGYSDIAIGSALIFGIKIPENFNNPYLKCNISLFWRNWHITLYRWLIDYIYIPLGGSRTTKIKGMRNILIVMGVSGLWHGAMYHFVIWGLYHGVLLSIYRIYSIYVKSSLKKFRLYRSYFMLVISVLVTFLLVTIGWVFFVADIETAIVIVGKLLFIT